jgi:3-deoxy-7-phosphoheptulonate synthase
MIWIGERTRQLDGAHIEFFRGLGNPIGVKLSAGISEGEFVALANTLNPRNEKGKLLAITRMGKHKIKDKLPMLIKAKRDHGLNLLFVTDPMHANTFESQLCGLKTRNIADMMWEISS